MLCFIEIFDRQKKRCQFETFGGALFDFSVLFFNINFSDTETSNMEFKVFSSPELKAEVS
jgi:hypothetical protein